MSEGGATGAEAPAASERVTSLRDVARTAGVSVSTASRVLSGSAHPVSATARSRVLDAAERLGFEPNRLARALATARSQTIGVMVHDVSDPYFAEIIRGLEDVAGARDHALFVTSSDRDPDKELALVKALMSHRVDAIILVASGLNTPGYLSELDRLLGRYRALGGVVVTMSEHSYQAPRVVIDNHRAMQSVVQHLVDLGHTSIAYLTGPPELAVSEARLQGYRMGLEEADIAFDERLVACGWFSMEGAAEATEALLEAQPTAMLAANDLMAIGALRRLLDLGRSVPGEISVAGVDDIEFAAYASVPLTTVRIELAEFGRRGAELAFQLLDGHAPPSAVQMEHELVVRASTGPRAS